MQQVLYTFALLLIFIFSSLLPAVAAKTSAAEMQGIIGSWPPEGWLLTPPGAQDPFPPYVADGEFSGTIYKQADQDRIWSAHISVIDHQSHTHTLRLLNNFPYCEETSVDNYTGRTCGTMGEDIGRRRLAYAAGRFLVEISVLGPLPLQMPELKLNIP